MGTFRFAIFYIEVHSAGTVPKTTTQRFEFSRKTCVTLINLVFHEQTLVVHALVCTRRAACRPCSRNFHEVKLVLKRQLLINSTNFKSLAAGAKLPLRENSDETLYNKILYDVKFQCFIY